jgi:hypothetical protein
VDSNQVPAEGKTMTGHKNEVTLGFCNSRAATSGVIAGLLILTGIVFQLGELGYSQMSHANLWLASVLAQSVWNMLVLRGTVLALHPLLEFWPLLLVSIGLAILLTARRQGTKMLSRNDTGDDRGQ